MVRQHGAPNPTASARPAHAAILDDLDDIDDLISRTAALGSSWFNRSSTFATTTHNANNTITISDDDDAHDQSTANVASQSRVSSDHDRSLLSQFGGGKECPAVGRGAHAGLMSSRKQMAMFNHRKQRPEHHLDTGAGQHRIAPLSGTVGSGRDQADPVELFNSMQIFGTMKTKPMEPARRSTGGMSLVAQEEFYTDPAKAASDLKDLLEGGMDEDEEEEEGPGVSANQSTVKPAQPEDSYAVQEDGKLRDLRVQLLPHQVEGVRWMKGRELGPVKKGKVPKGGILADDMGLGKTLQTLSLIISHQKPSPDSPQYKKHYTDIKKPTLVVAPLALIRQWEAEINDKVGANSRLKVYVHHGPNRTKSPGDLARYDVVVTTYQILVSEYGASSEGHFAGCFGVHWWRVVLDEAHIIKNRNAKATKACCALRSEFRWCLTGTPMQNNLDELQSLICFLKIRPYDDLREWRDHIDKPMKNGKGHIAIHRLHSLLRCFMKRRTKEILKEEGALQPGGKKALEAAHQKNIAEGKLDAPISSTGFRVTQRKIELINAKFAPAERLFYQRLEERADQSMERMIKGKINYANALVLLLRLRQACNHPKLVEGKLEKDHEAVGDSLAKSGNSNADVDALVDLFAGVDIQAKVCSICGRDLGKEEIKDSGDTCKECYEDLAWFDAEQNGEQSAKPKPSKSGKSEKKKKEKTKKKKNKNKIRSKQNYVKRKSRRVVDSDNDDDKNIVNRSRNGKNRSTRRILDSDKEEEEGSWLVSESERGQLHLGKTGGTTDEDAEGGGNSIGTEDSEHSSEEEEDSRISSFIVSGDEGSSMYMGSRKFRRGNRQVIDSDGSDEDIVPKKAVPQLKSRWANDDTESLYSSSESSDESDKESRHAAINASDFYNSSSGINSSNFSSLYRKQHQSSAQIFTSSKIRELLRILRAEVKEHKFIVFSQFTSMLSMVEPFLNQEGIRHVRYDGGMRNDEREASLKSLRGDPRTRVLLCSLKCGSLGLNLTAATRVVILEPFWNPFIEEQAIDRVHRLTQTVDIIVYKLTIEGTVEERILQLQEKKRMLAEQAIEGGMKKGAFKLGMKEMMELFKRDGDGKGIRGLEEAKTEYLPQRGSVLRGNRERIRSSQQSHAQADESLLYGRR